MAVTLTTSYQDLGYVTWEEDRSFYYYYCAKYQKQSNTTARVYVCFKARSTGSESASCSGATFHATLNGTAKTASSGSFSVPRRTSSSGYGEIYFDVTYGNDGKWANKTLTCWITGGSGTYSGGYQISTCKSSSSQSYTVTLPEIDPVPAASITSVAIQENGFENNVIASITKVRVTMSLTKCRSAVLSWSGAGVNDSTNISVSYSTSAATKTYDLIVPANSTNYNLVFTLKGSNNTTTVTATSTKAIKGYELPTYSNETYTTRCNSLGVTDAQGEYGKLYLKWNVKSIGTNSLQTCTVKLNGTTISSTSGSIANGYLEYIFALTLNTQGDLEIYLADKIYHNTITTLSIPKSIMPLSLYQSNTDVGVAIGRMATQAGFYEYLDFFLKGKNTNVFYEIYIDSNGVLHVGSNSVAYGSGGNL